MQRLLLPQQQQQQQQQLKRRSAATPVCKDLLPASAAHATRGISM
jgi:hypothetical protein